MGVPRRPFAGKFERGISIECGMDIVAFALQIAAHQVDGIVLIIHDEDLRDAHEAAWDFLMPLRSKTPRSVTDRRQESLTLATR